MRDDEGREAALLLRVYEAKEDPRGVAEGFGMTLEELALWAGRERTMRALRGLRLVADMQTQLILSRYRLTAAAKLVQLAGQDESAETARRACVDLLKAELSFPEGEVGDAGEVADPREVLEALGRMGEGDV